LAADFLAAFFAVFLTATWNSLGCGTHVFNALVWVKVTSGSRAFV
jgi:hypothetical protein